MKKKKNKYNVGGTSPGGPRNFHPGKGGISCFYKNSFVRTGSWGSFRAVGWVHSFQVFFVVEDLARFWAIGGGGAFQGGRVVGNIKG